MSIVDTAEHCEGCRVRDEIIYILRAENDRLRKLASELDGKLGMIPCRENRCIRFAELRADNEALHRDRNDLALFTHRLIHRLRAARVGKGTPAGDDDIEDQVKKLLTRKGLIWLLPEDVGM